MNKSLQSLRITLLNIAHVHLDKKWDYDNVVSPFSRLYYIKSGKASIYHHNHLFHLKAGYLYLIPSFTYSRYKCDNKMEQIYLHFLEEVGSGLSVYNLLHMQYEIKATELTRQLVERLLELNPKRALSNEDPKVYDNRPSTNAFEARNNGLLVAHFLESQAIMQFLLASFIEEKRPPGPVNFETNKITETIYYISEHLDKELTVEHLASFCHLHPDYFSRLFKKQIGVRPLDYLHNRRIERAQVLLTTTNHTLQQIADMVGLASLSYFSRLFSKVAGKSPARYRKEHWSV